MSPRIAVAVLATLFTACDRVENPVAPSSSPNEGVVSVVGPGVAYSGRATAVDATVGVVNTKVCDTGPLPPSGGNITHSVASAPIPGVLVANILYCTTSGSNNVAKSEAAVAEVRLTIAGNVIWADVLSSMARASCNGSASTNGHSHVARLSVNGQGQAITGSPNQTIQLPNGIGYIRINEQSGFVNPGSASKTVTALRVVITGVADFKFARSHADIDCV